MMREPLPACIARVTSVPIEALGPLAAEAAVARLGPWLDAERELDAERVALDAELFAAAGPATSLSPERARARTGLLAVRRDLHHGRRSQGGWGTASLAALPTALEHRLSRHAERLDAHQRERDAIDALFGRELERAERALVAAMSTPLAAQGLRLVSRSLLDKLRRAAALDPSSWRHDHRHAAAKALAYLGRSATKTSPNGVFCATARAAFRHSGPALAGENRLTRVEVRLNVGEARKISACLAVDPALETIVRPRPNPTLRRTPSGWTFWRPASPRHADDSEVRSEAPEHPVLTAFLEEAQRGTLSVPRLIAAAATRCGLDPAANEVRAFYRKLAATGLLVAELEVPWSSWRPLADLARLVREAGSAPGWLAEVEAIERAVDELGGPVWGATAMPAMDAVEARLQRLPHERPLAMDELFRADAATGIEIALPEALLDELSRFTSFYARFYSAMYPAPLYRSSFVRRFLARHAADTDVELIDLYHDLDPAERPRPAAFPELHRGDGREPAWSAAGAEFQRLRDHFAARAREASGQAEIAISPEDWERLLGDRPVPSYSCGVLFQVGARDVESLAAGRWRACLNAIYPGGGLSVSRLASLHRPRDGTPGWIEAELRRGHRGLERDGAVLAEVSFMHGGRTANAGLRPPLLAHEIELPGDRATPGTRGLPLADLTVRYDSASGEFILRSRSLATRVQPIVSSGISSDGLISFLVEIGRQGTQPLAYFPGFDVEDVARWPRVRCGNVVLFRQRWRFGPGQAPRGEARRIDAAAFVAVARWRERHGLPRHVFVHSSEDPKPFYVDLESPLFVERMLRSVPGSARVAGTTAPPAFHVTEMLPAPDELWVRDTAGRYASEFLVHLEHPAAGVADKTVAVAGGVATPREP